MTPLVVALVFVLSVPTGDIPAVRLNDAVLAAGQEVQAPVPGDCDTYKQLALDAGWTEEQWPTLKRIVARESECYPDAANRVGAVGLLQETPTGTSGIRHLFPDVDWSRGPCIWRGRRYRCTPALTDPATNLAVGKAMFDWWDSHGRSGWQPWKATRP